MAADPASPTGPHPARARLAQAARCFAAGQLDEAAALCEAVLADIPDDAEACRQLGLVQVVRGAFEAAHALLEPIAPRFDADADFQLALAEAVWGTRSAAAALPRFEAAVALAPDRPRLRLRLGQALLAADRAEAARAELALAAAALPDSALALTQLAMAEAATGATEQALQRFEAALALDPSDGDAAFQLGQTLRAIGRLDDALAALRDGVRRDPSSALLRLALGDALHAGGRADSALGELREAVRLAPHWALAWSALGRTVQRLGRTQEAITYYRTARGLDRNKPELDAMIGNALTEIGATAEAEAHFARSMAEASWTRPAAASRSRLRVGVLLAPGANNTPTGFILDAAAHDLELVFMLDRFDYPYDRIAASYDVLFNAIGDPDRAASALARAGLLADATALPIVNPPGRVAETGRDRMAARLEGISGCAVPPTGRFAIPALATADGLEAAARDIDWPLLARPVGSHGGTGLVKLDSPAALAAQLGRIDADELYLTRFCDFRSADGRYRKYRFIVVAGEVFPYHLAIGDDWLVHYFRTDMAADPTLLAEEARFLADPHGCLGPAIAEALGEIARRVPLDFFGLDCSVDPAGHLLVFECNAAMLVHNAEPSPLFEYKRGPTGRIRQAVGRLLEQRAGRAT